MDLLTLPALPPKADFVCPVNTKVGRKPFSFKTAMDDGGVTIWASELASAIGKHRYKTRDETFSRVWLRSDRKSFCLAYSLMFKEEIITLIGASNESDTLRGLLDKGTEAAQFLELMKKVILEPMFKTLFLQILNFIKGIVFEGEREKLILAASKDLYQQVVSQTKALCRDERKTVATAVKELCAKTGEPRKEVIAAAESKITKDRGTGLESKAIQDFMKAKGIDMEVPYIQESYYKSVEFSGLTWTIVGKPDKRIEQGIVEVKNRKTRFIRPIPEYDYIQLQTYMFLCDEPRGILLERLRGQNTETPFAFDEISWKEEIIPELAFFVSEVSNCIREYQEDLLGPPASSCASPTPKRRKENNAG